MSKRVLLPLLTCVAGLVAYTPASQAAELTARDLRMETRTQWDYQPGQGPRRKASDRDFFRPSKPLPENPLTPPPPVVPGDWRNPPSAESMVPVRPRQSELHSHTGLDIGVQGSHYHYHEKDVAMKLQGPQGGFHLMATGYLGSHWSLRGEVRFTAGSMDYKGSGEMDTNPNYTTEVRATVGRDLLMHNFSITPYVGLGYRHLLSDIRGVTNTGAVGYQRHSHYFFVPVGIQPKVLLPNNDTLSLMAEFDPLVLGSQVSMLNDADSRYPELQNKQRGGYGIRGNLMYQTGNWGFGPFVNYWNIDRSRTDCATGSGAGALYVCGYEPHNHTVEYGMQLRYRFYEDRE